MISLRILSSFLGWIYTFLHFTPSGFIFLFWWSISSFSMIPKILERVWKNLYKSLFLINILCVGTQLLSPVQLFLTLWTVAHQPPVSMGFSRQEYWSGLPCPPPGDVPYPGVEPVSPTSPAVAGGFFTTEPSGILAGGKNIVHKLFVITFECYTSISGLPW